VEIIFLDANSNIVSEGEAQSFADAREQLVANYQEQGVFAAVWVHPNPRCNNPHCRTALWLSKPDDPSHIDHECGINPDLSNRKPFSGATRCTDCILAHYEERKQGATV
jgi:hypothetical protein